MTTAIELVKVEKSYGAGRRRKQVVRDCSLAIEDNAFTVMIGPSGAGKSTLVRLIAGFERPDAGRITMDGAPIVRPSKDRLVMFQETALFSWMTTGENVSFGPGVRGENSSEVRDRARALLRRFGLQAFGAKYPPQLSGGMQRRAELARALLNEPRVMILDEPFRGLDAMTKELMLEYYAKLYEATPRTNLFVTTDIDEAIFLADRLLIMTHIPTRVAAVIEVDLPRPRSLTTVVSDDRANRIKQRALALLRDEGLRAFGDRRSGSGLTRAVPAAASAAGEPPATPALDR
jgi:NitT/TauT family transport system ATP-binding protein